MPRVTVFGSLHYDITVHSPARPRKGETVTGSRWAPKCGGKGGNQAVSAARAGAEAEMIGAVGDDDFGSTLLANLDRAGVDRRLVSVEPDTGSGISVAIFDAEGDYGAVIVSGANLKLTATHAMAAGKDLGQTRILVLQNEVPEVGNIAAAKSVRASGGITLLNAAPTRPVSDELMKLVDVLIVNAIEAEAFAEIAPITSLDEAMAAAHRLTLLCPSVVVTAGGEGVAFADRAGNTAAIPAALIRVASTHGAGDEFVGVLAAELARGTSMERALHVANHAAALLVSTPEERRL